MTIRARVARLEAKTPPADDKPFRVLIWDPEAETLDEAKVEEKFPKRRVRGKQPRLKQLIPAEDALRMVEGAAHGAADAERTSGDRRVNALHELANQAMEQQKREMDSVKREADAKVRFHRGKAVAAKSAAQAAKGAARTYRRRVNENALTVDNVMRLATQHLGADTVSEVVRKAYNA